MHCFQRVTIQFTCHGKLAEVEVVAPEGFSVKIDQSEAQVFGAANVVQVIVKQEPEPRPYSRRRRRFRHNRHQSPAESEPMDADEA